MTEEKKFEGHPKKDKTPNTPALRREIIERLAKGEDYTTVSESHGYSAQHSLKMLARAYTDKKMSGEGVRQALVAGLIAVDDCITAVEATFKQVDAGARDENRYYKILRRVHMLEQWAKTQGFVNTPEPDAE